MRSNANAFRIKAVQEAYAGKDYYGVMVAAVMTNQNFTKSAVEFTKKLNVILWDGDHVMNLIHDTTVPEKKKNMRLVRPESENVKTDFSADKHMGQ